MMRLRLELVLEPVRRALPGLRVLQVDAVPVGLILGALGDLRRDEWRRWAVVLVVLLVIVEGKAGS